MGQVGSVAIIIEPDFDSLEEHRVGIPVGPLGIVERQSDAIRYSMK
jgi:hypothetical protein